MLRDDLAGAREAWLKEAEKDPTELKRRTESDFLLYRNSAGKVADFHALRHTFVTQIVAGGTNVKVAQELARHSTPVLTLKRYSHLGLHDTSKALNALPSITPAPNASEQQEQQLRRTGTDDVALSPIAGKIEPESTGELRITGGEEESETTGSEITPPENLASHLASFAGTDRYKLVRTAADSETVEPEKTHKNPRKPTKKAEAVGFEPTEDLRLLRFSRPVH